MSKVNILNSQIEITNIKQILSDIENLLKDKKQGYICFSNVHTVVHGYKDILFRIITNGALIAAPDGMPLVWVGRSKGNKKMQRCSGPDVMEELFRLSGKKGYTHYFYGASEETLIQLERNLKTSFPDLKIAGMYSPPFRELTGKEDFRIVEEINRIEPDFVWVGLGAPKQEKWMYEHSSRINNSILLGVGAAFNFHAGTVARAPTWMQKSGMEWLYRLCQEPQRLWKRYLVVNTLFILYFVREELGKFFSFKKEKNNITYEV